MRHRAILKAIWRANGVDQPEHLWTLVAQLRKTIEDPSNARYLLSEPWVGCRFAPASPQAPPEPPAPAGAGRLDGTPAG